MSELAKRVKGRPKFLIGDDEDAIVYDTDHII